MAVARDFNVNLKADASNLLQAVQSAATAFNNLLQVINRINQQLQNLNATVGQTNIAPLIRSQMKASGQFVEQWATDAKGNVISYGQVVKQTLPAGFDAAKEAAAEMAAATAQGFNNVRVTIDAAGRMTTKVTKDMTGAEQKLAVHINEVLVKLQQMSLGAKHQDQLTFSTRRYNEQLITSKQYLSELVRIQRSAQIAQEVGQRRARAEMFASGAAMLYLGKRALKMGKDVMGAFSETAYSIWRMQLVMGGTAEELSKLKFAGDQVGVTAKELVTRWGLLEAHLAKNDQYAQRLGVSYKNLDGSIKSPLELLGEIGDRLNGVTDAMKRSTMAREVFGRGYQAILPLLRQGSAGLNEIAKNAEKFGLVLDETGKQSGVRYKMAMKQMSQSLTGLKMAIAQSAAPAVAMFAHIMSNFMRTLMEAYRSTGAFGRAIRAVVPALGMIASGLIAAGVAFKFAKMASAAFSATLWTMPITWIAAALLALAAGLVYVAKNFSWGVEVVGYFGAAIGGLVGVVVSVGSTVAMVVSAIVTGLAKAASWIGRTFRIGWLEDAGNAVGNFMGEMTAGFAKLAAEAPKAGWEMGFKYGKAAGEAIKNMELPSLADLLGEGEDVSWEGGGGGGSRAKNKIQKMFEDMVSQARDALNALKDKALQAKKEMDDMSKSVRDSLKSAFSITDIAGEGFVGPKGLMWSFRRRLKNMRGFVDNVKQLHQMGLPTDMLVEIVNAGVSGGAEVAKMLVRNPQVITELASLQKQIVSETSAAGEYVAGIAMGPQVAQYVSEASAYQGQFAQLLGQAGRFGYTPSQEDIQAAYSNISNQVYMDVGTNASPFDIEAAIAWALRTGAVRQFGAGRGRGTTQSGGTSASDVFRFLFGGSGGGGGNTQLAPGLQGSTLGPGWQPSTLSLGQQGLGGQLMPSSPNPQSPYYNGGTGP